MICPYCGKVNEKIPTPNLTKRGTRVLLGKCVCGKEVWAIPTQKKRERSQLATVEEGEAREKILADIYIQYEDGTRTERRELADDIDRNVYDENGEIIYYLEIKERSNSLNAYYDTQFPYAKIESGKKLIGGTGLSVYIVLKFIDCWARHRIVQDQEYRKGDKPFAPQYRPWQRSKERQIPVMIPVESLEILPWRNLCEDIKA
ncbi:hypothetical protein ES703_28303 [subsurface metagenome]